MRPGGILALHEIGYFGEVAGFNSRSSSFEAGSQMVLEFFQSGLPHFDVGQRLVERFYLAELPQPGCSASYLWAVDRIPLFRIGW